MNIGKSISLVGIAAVVTAIVAAVDATAIYYFHLNVLTTLVVTIFLFHSILFLLFQMQKEGQGVILLHVKSRRLRGTSWFTLG